MATAKLESAIQRDVKYFLTSLGWMVYPTTCGAFMRGLPDLICHHPAHRTRFIDVKRPKGSTLTKYQVQLWSEWEKYDLGVWILTGPDETPLFKPPNWREWYKPRYDKYLLRKPADILRDTS